MYEVSCRVLEAVLDHVERSGLDLEQFAEGLPYSVKHLRDPSSRIDWETYVQLMRRLRPQFPTPADWEQLGRQFVRSKQMLRLKPLFRLLINPQLVAKWL